MKGIKQMISTGRALVLATVLSLVGTLTAQAQVDYHLGVIGGAQYTNLVADRGKFTGKVGFVGGISNEFRIGESQAFSIQADILYSMKNADRIYKDSVDGYYDRVVNLNINRYEHLNYVDLHLLFKYNLFLGYDRIIPYDRPGKRVFLSFYAGPQFGYLVNYKSGGYVDSTYSVKIQRDSSIQPPRRNRTIYDFNSFKAATGYAPVLKTDIGVTVGTGVNFLVGDRATISLDARYTYGIGTIDYFAYSQKVVVQDENPANSHIEYRQNTVAWSTFSGMLGIKFRIVGKGPNRNF